MTSKIRKARAGTERTMRNLATEYDEMATPVAQQIQNSLVNLISGGSHPIENPQLLRRQLGEFAASDPMLNLLKAMPAAGGLYGVAAAGDIVAGEESFANKGMDILGMGAGYYGINRGVNALGGTTPAGRALSTLASIGLGKMGSDAAQGVIGG